MVMEQNARRLGRQSPEPYPEPGHEDGTECQKNRETIPGTLPATKMIEEMMMEQNARIPGTNLVEQNCFLKDLRTPFSSRDVWARNPSQNQEIMMEQDAKRIGDKPGTLAGTRKG